MKSSPSKTSANLLDALMAHIRNIVNNIKNRLIRANMTAEEQLHEITRLLHEKKKTLRYRLHYISGNQFWHFDKTIKKYGYSAGEFDFIRRMHLDRGEILEAFSKIEFLTNEIIRLKLLGYESDQLDFLDELLEKVDFSRKYNLLTEHEIIDKSLRDALARVKKVRDKFAHVWITNSIPYRDGKTLEQEFDSFKQDLEALWSATIDAYKIEQSKIDLSNILQEIRNS